MHVDDPDNLLGRGYDRNGVNEPMLSNIRKALEEQSNLGHRALTHRMFTTQVEEFILARLSHVAPRELYAGDYYNQ